jgi:hypothetical protein
MGTNNLKPNSPYAGLSFQENVERRRVNRMAAIDALSPDQRGLVHDYGFTVVKTLMDQGITKPSVIRHIVETVLNEFSPTRGSSSLQGVRRAFGVGDGAP